jgi:hypothetical protein
VQVYVSLDVELFFGARSGTPERCIIEPLSAIEQVSVKRGAFLTLFVDAGYLCALKRASATNVVAKQDLRKLSVFLSELSRRGHDLQLHIHPHWEDAELDGATWRFPLHRYKLEDYSVVEAEDIIERYGDAIAELSGERPFAYRAGGWCVPDFSRYGMAFLRHGVWLDSTAYAGGFEQSASHSFNFRELPNLDLWRFSGDVSTVDPNGPFVELPIAATQSSPAHYWAVALRRKLGGARHRAFGDGTAVSSPVGSLFRKLVAPSPSVVSVDGSKSSLLAGALRRRRKSDPNAHFVVMGHPKAVTPSSLHDLRNLLDVVPEGEFATFSSNRDAIRQQVGLA